MEKTTIRIDNDMFTTEYIARDRWDCNINDMADMFYGLLRSSGYTHRSIALVLDCKETYETRQELELTGEL